MVKLNLDFTIQDCDLGSMNFGEVIKIGGVAYCAVHVGPDEPTDERVYLWVCTANDNILKIKNTDGTWCDICEGSGGNVENGEDGFSPIATVEQTANGAVISITDKSGTTTATITNGADGVKGIGFLYYDGSGLYEDEDYISVGDLKKPYNYIPKVGDLVLCADGWVFTIVTFAEGDAAEVRSTGICLMGADGSSGKDGTSVTVSNVSESSASGGTNVVTFSDGEKVNIKNGKDGVGIAHVDDTGDGTIEFYGPNWEYLGEAQLPQGEKGDPGDRGEQGVGIGSIDTGLTEEGNVAVTIEDTYSNILAEFEIPGGKPGKDGKDGKNGVGIDYVDDPGDGTMEIYGTNGEMLGVVTLPPGKQGEPGKDGYTPQKNVDYFDGKDGKDGTPGSPGANGRDGITPHVGSNGNWFIGENDTGIPATGPAGGQGLPGEPGEDGEPGERGIGFLYYDGSGLYEDEDYISVSDLKKPYNYVPKVGDLVLCADGWVFTIVTFAEGDAAEVRSTGICLMGADGSSGKDGTSVTVSNVSESSASGGTNVVTFSDGKKVNIKNGKDGADGNDYVLTEDDKTEMVSAVLAALPVYQGEVEDV